MNILRLWQNWKFQRTIKKANEMITQHQFDQALVLFDKLRKLQLNRQQAEELTIERLTCKVSSYLEDLPDKIDWTNEKYRYEYELTYLIQKLCAKLYHLGRITETYKTLQWCISFENFTCKEDALIILMYLENGKSLLSDKSFSFEGHYLQDYLVEKSGMIIDEWHLLKKRIPDFSHSEIRKRLDPFLNECPSVSDILMRFGDIYHTLGEEDRSLKYYKWGVQLNLAKEEYLTSHDIEVERIEWVWIRGDLVGFYTKLNEYEKALQNKEDLLALFDIDEPAYFVQLLSKTLFYEEFGKVNEAIDACRLTRKWMDDNRSTFDMSYDYSFFKKKLDEILMRLRKG